MLRAYPQPEKSSYQLEWDDLIDAIRQDGLATRRSEERSQVS